MPVCQVGQPGAGLGVLCLTHTHQPACRLLACGTPMTCLMPTRVLTPRHVCLIYLQHHHPHTAHHQQALLRHNSAQHAVCWPPQPVSPAEQQGANHPDCWAQGPSQADLDIRNNTCNLCQHLQQLHSGVFAGWQPIVSACPSWRQHQTHALYKGRDSLCFADTHRGLHRTPAV